MLETTTASFALKAGVSEPFDTDTVTDLDRRVQGMLSNGDDLANTFMTADQGCLGGDGPVALASVEIGVADTGAVHLDETLAGGELLGPRHLVLGVDDDRGVRVLDDSGGLNLGDGVGHGRM